METKFTFGTVLNFILSYTSAGPKQLADYYVNRHRSLVYKWKLDQAFPSKELFPGIIEFAEKESRESTQPAMRSQIDACIRSSGLSSMRKQQIIEEDSFQDYLLNVINELAILWREKGDTLDLPEKDESDPPDSPVKLCAAEDDEKDALPQPAMVQAENTQLQPVPEQPRPIELAIHITFSNMILLNIFLAAAACLAGDGLWAALSWVLRWPNDAWTQGGGLQAFLWGLLFTFPVVALAMLSLRGKGSPVIGKNNRLLLTVGFTTAGGVAALLLALSAPGRLLGGQDVSALNKIFLVFVSALVMTFLPTLTLLALLRFPKIGAIPFLLMELGPAFLCILFALPTILAGTWLGGAFWLGGFLAGGAAKIAMYFAVWQILKGYPDEIGMPFFSIPQV